MLYNMFMAFHNSNNGFKGFPPHDEAVIGYASGYTVPRERDGLFYRSDLPIDYDELGKRLIEYPYEASIQDYQYWTEAGWKTPQGSYDSVDRLANKIVEEQSELAKAMYEADRANDDNLPLAREHILEEAGDVLWVTTSLASIANADIDSGLKNLLFEYVMGVQHFKDGQVIEPKWRKKVANLATKYHQLTVSDLERLVGEGFEPLPSPVINVFDPEEDFEDVDKHMVTVLGLAHEVRNLVQQQFGGDAEARAEGDITYQLPTAFRERARLIGRSAARMYLELAFIAERATNRGLSDMVSMNVAKITERIATGTVDKADGERPPEA